MKKLAIPVGLLAIVAIAGIFALVPIEQASTVHTTILAAGTSSTTLLLDGVQISHDAGGAADVDPNEIIILYDGFGNTETATIEINTNLEDIGVMNDTAVADELVMEELKSGTWTIVTFAVQGTLNSDHADVDNVQGLRLRMVDDGAGTATITFADNAYIDLTFIGS